MSTVGTDPTIRTYTGKRFNFLWPAPDMIDIQDIAHALSQTCRFAGQAMHFYSVAQHSVLVSMLVEGDAGLQYCGLMHDASEAYIHDISRPLKSHLPEYHVIEQRVMKALALKFSFTYPLPHAVMHADNLALAWEGGRFMHGTEDEFGRLPVSIKRNAGHVIARSLPPEEAKKLFLDRFKELK